MGAVARSAATLAVLGLIVAVWLVWGLTQATRPLPSRATVSTCTDVTVTAGDKVTPSAVTVSVLNAGTRNGLAGRTMQLFTDAGFPAGDSGNAPVGTDVPNAQIWAADPRNPAVRLVLSRLPGAEVVDQPSTAAGVTVVVGDQFAELAPGRRQVRARENAVVCTPSG